MKTELKKKGWVVVSPTNKILDWTFDSERGTAINIFEEYQYSKWLMAKKDGYTVKKAELTIKLEEK